MFTRSHGSVGRTIWYRLKNPLLRDALLVVHTVIYNRKIASEAVKAKPHQIDTKVLDFQGFSSFLGTFGHFRGVQNTPLFYDVNSVILPSGRVCGMPLFA